MTAMEVDTVDCGITNFVATDCVALKLDLLLTKLFNVYMINK